MSHNTTIFSLTLSKQLTLSPLLAPSSYSNSLKFNLLNFNLKKFISPAYVQFSNQVSTHFENSHFSHFLSTPIVITNAACDQLKKNVLNDDGRWSNISSGDSICINKVTFSDIKTTGTGSFNEKVGGAIFIKYPSQKVTLIDIGFFRCESGSYCGAIYVESNNIDSKQLCFEYCKSGSSAEAGWYNMGQSLNLKVESFFVYNCNDQDNGHDAFLITAGGGNIIGYNATSNYLHTRHCAGLEVHTEYPYTSDLLTISFCSFIENKGKSILGLVDNSNQKNNVYVEKTVFYNNTKANGITNACSCWIISYLSSHEVIFKYCNWEDNKLDYSIINSKGAVETINCYFGLEQIKGRVQTTLPAEHINENDYTQFDTRACIFNHVTETPSDVLIIQAGDQKNDNEIYVLRNRRGRLEILAAGLFGMMDLL